MRTHFNFRESGKYGAMGISGLLISLMISQASCIANDNANSIRKKGAAIKTDRNASGIHAHITTDDSVRSMVNHPAFKGFGRYLLPRDNGTSDYGRPLNQVGSLMPYHSHVNPNVVVAAINYMIDQVNNGKTLFYDFYTEQQKREDPAKASTSLFFFKGRPGAPFAIVCPGGGFAYVGSLHEGFPHAMALSQKGYNVFVLKI